MPGLREQKGRTASWEKIVRDGFSEDPGHWVEFLGSLMDSIEELVSCKDVQGRYIICNRGFAEHLGLSREQVVGKTDEDLYSAEMAAAHRQLDQLVLTERRRQLFEEWTPYPHDRWVLMESCKIPFLDNGELRGIISVSRDITERKKTEEQGYIMAAELQETVAHRTRELERAVKKLQKEIEERKKVEAALRESEATYRLILDSTYDRVWSADPQGLYTFASPSWQKTMGYDPEDVVGKSFESFVHPDDLPAFRARLEEAVRGGVRRVSGMTYRMRHTDGAWLWFEVDAIPIYNEDGTLRIMIGVSKDITDRKRAEDELVSKNALLEAQMEATIDGILVVDGSGEKILANKRFYELRHTPLHMIGDKNCNRLLQCIADQAKAPELFLERITYLQNHPDETSRDEIEFKDGMVVERYSAPVLDKDGNHYGQIWTFRDITGRKQNEERLKESQQQLADIIEFLPDATFVIDKGRKVISWNRAMEEMTGVNATDIMGKGDYEYGRALYGGKRPILIDMLLNASEEDESRYFNFCRGDSFVEAEGYLPAFKRKGDAYLYGKASLLRDSKGNVVGAIESIRNITARHQAEEKYKAIFDTAVMGICQATPEGRLISANPAFARMLGYDSPEDALTSLTNIAEFLYINPALHEEYMQYIEKSGGVLQDEAQFRRKDGRVIWVSLTAVAVRDGSGNITCYQGSLMDITERKQLEDQLRQSQKMEAIGTLAGGIAHDFNNILSAVLGYTDLALRESITDRLRLYLDRIHKGGLQAGELVKQILTFSRQSEEKLYSLRVNPVVKEVMKLLRASIPTTIDIQEQIKADPDIIMANPSYVHQILMNLCTNAAQAMKGNKGILKVNLRPVDVQPDDSLISRGLSPGMHLNLTVSDTGTGIAPDIIGKIFDPFFTTKKPGEGTGMGLSVVHGIVKRCGGAITVQSEPGKGAMFNVYFPLLKEMQEADEQEGKVDIVGGTESILYVDDDEVIAQLGIGMLTFLGYKVVSKTSSIEALELFKSQPEAFDLVVTDMTMPRMTGVELAQELMRIRPDIPVILCTGFSEVVTPENAREFGLREVVMKPIILDQLAAVIRRELDRKT